MKTRATKETVYSVWKCVTGEGWIPWGREHATLRAAERDLRENYRGFRGDVSTFQIVQITLERISGTK